MARQLIWTDQALDDIDDIANFIASDSQANAERVVAAFFATADDIPPMPFAGRIVPEQGRADLRERFVYSYRLMYRIEPDRVAMLAVFHSSRAIESALIDRVSQD